MKVGVLKISLHLPDKTSLKEKRAVVKSLSSQLKNRFNISIAEVDDNDKWQLATLGISCVSNDSRYTHELLNKALSFITSGRFDVEVIGTEVEIITL